jgi:hypothetical protein
MCGQYSQARPLFAQQFLRYPPGMNTVFLVGIGTATLARAEAFA